MRTGIVLAGGRSTRFGGDKLAEPIDGDPLLERAVTAVAAVTDEIIVAGTAAVPGSANVRMIPDAEPFGGPLLALAAALHEARGSSALVVGGDMPRLVADVLRTMLDRLEAGPIDAVILARPDPERGAPRQVLPMALRVAQAAAAARAALDAGGRSLQALLERLRSIELAARDWLPLDPAADTLLDVDTRADLERIRAPTRG